MFQYAKIRECSTKGFYIFYLILLCSLLIRSTQLFVSGCLAGIFTTVIVAPGERIKCLLQVRTLFWLKCRVFFLINKFKCTFF